MHLKLLFCFSYLILVPVIALSQTQENPIEIFGYFQSVFDHSHERTTITSVGSSVRDRNSFLLQQLNVLGAKRFSSQFSCFLGLEFTNSFSSSRNWGSFRLDEAWFKYEHADAFNVKAGFLVPTFNNLHEIKNRTPLLPYIVRPLVYEALVAEFFQTEDFLPEKAYLQLFGFVPLSEAKLDYAVFVGNSESSMINSVSSIASLSPSGADTTTYKMIGGRVGARYRQLKAGFSMTFDKDNRTDLGIGLVHRVRYGGDLSYQISGFNFEGEIIYVDEPLSSTQQATVDFTSQFNPLVETCLDKVFWYGNVMYDFNEKFYAYTGYQQANLNVHSTNSSNVYVFTVGGGFRPIENVVIKTQFLRLKATSSTVFQLFHSRYEAAISVYF